MDAADVEHYFWRAAETQRLQHRVAELEEIVRQQQRHTNALASFSPATLRPTFEQLSHIAKLEPDWDSYGADPPSAAVIGEAARLIVAVMERFSPMAGESARPWAVAPFSGGVQVEWRTKTGALEVEIRPGGQFGYLLEEGMDSNPRYEEGDDIHLEEVLRLIARILQPTPKG